MGGPAPPATRKPRVMAQCLLKKRVARRRAEGLQRVVGGAADAAPQGPAPKRPRATHPRTDWANGAAAWAKLLQGPGLREPGTRAARQFRNRFRLPFAVFDEICTRFEDEGWLQTRAFDVAKRATTPFRVKVMGALRHLGRGLCFDDIAEMPGVSGETLRVFTRAFFAKVATHLSPEWVKMPGTTEEIRRAVAMHTQMGLPGAIGPTGGVHVCWGRCPAGETNAHTGKEGCPTLVFNVTARHDGYIQHVAGALMGNRNDKTTVRFDKFVAAVRGGKHKGCAFEVCTSGSAKKEVKGLWLICDGGCHRWRCLQCPVKISADRGLAAWSRWLESVRKGVECCFGRLKRRFRVLALPLQCHNKKAAEGMFKSAAVLHNMLLSHDGLDSQWEAECDEEEDGQWAAACKHKCRGQTMTVCPDTGWSCAGGWAHCAAEAAEQGFFELRKGLKTHFAIAFARGEVQWLGNGLGPKGPFRGAHN